MKKVTTLSKTKPKTLTSEVKKLRDHITILKAENVLLKKKLTQKRNRTKSKNMNLTKKIGFGVAGLGTLGVAFAVAKKYGLLDKLLSKIRSMGSGAESLNNQPPGSPTPTQVSQDNLFRLESIATLLGKTVEDLRANGIPQIQLPILASIGISQDDIRNLQLKIV